MNNVRSRILEKKKKRGKKGRGGGFYLKFDHTNSVIEYDRTWQKKRPLACAELYI